MTLDITIDGSGEVGHVASWSVKESATQHSLAQSSGSVGSLDIAAAAVVSGKSAYLNDCGISVSDGTGAWSGRIMDAPTTGAAVTVKAEGALRFLNAVRTAPPAGSYVEFVSAFGSINTAPSFGVAVDGRFLYPGGIAFDSSGNMFVADRGTYTIHKYTLTAGVWTLVASVGGRGTGNGQFGSASGAADDGPHPGWLATDSSGNVYATDSVNNRIQKFTNGLVYSAKVTTMDDPRGLAVGPSDEVVVVGEGLLNVYNTSLVYQSGSGVGSGGFYGSVAVAPNGDRYITAEDDAGRYLFVSGTAIVSRQEEGTADGAFGAGSGPNPYDLAIRSDGYVFATDYYNGRVQKFTAGLEYAGKFGSFGSELGQLSSPAGIAIDPNGDIHVADLGNNRISKFTGVGANTLPLSEAIESYIRLCDPDSDHAYSYDCANDPDVNFPGWTDSVWRKLNELCAVYNIEIYYQAGTVHVGDIGARELDIPNTTVPTRTPESIQPARSVQVVNQNIVAADGLTMYDAADANTIHTVDVGRVRVITLATNNHPASLNYPTPIDAAPIGAGQYCVQDSTGAAIDAADWTAAGGNVTVAVGEATGTIVLTITGPSATIAGTTAPYSLASGTGTSRVATLSITGSGVTTNPQIVTAPTGADPTRIKQEVARTIDVPFIGTLGQAYDAGVWAACDSLFGLTLKFRIPRESGKTFGDYAGRKFTWGNARWRVTDAVIDETVVDITARWHTTVGEFDDAWAGETVGDVDTAWDGYLLRDTNVTPLATDLP